MGEKKKPTLPPGIGKLVIERVRLDAMKPAPYNPRQISEHAKQGLTTSIKEFNYVDPIIFNKRTGNIVGGNQRYGVLKSMGVQEVDVVVIDIDLEKEKTLNVTLNNPEISGEYTKDLSEILQNINLTDKDLYKGLNLDGLEKKLDDLLFNEMNAERADLDAVAEFARGNAKADGFFFYIEYYGQPERFERIKSKLKMKTKHEIDPNTFEKMALGE